MAPNPVKVKQELDIITKKITKLDTELKKLGSSKAVVTKFGNKKDADNQQKKLHELQFEKKELVKSRDKLLKELQKVKEKK